MKTKIILLTIVFSITFWSCADYLEMTPDEDLSIEEVFNNRLFSEQFLSNIYGMLPDEVEFNLYTGASDEMEVAYGPHYSHYISNGSWNATNIMDFWGDCYKAIRKCNIFLANADKIPTDAATIATWKAEVYFLRAFNYFQIIRCYGPAVLIDKSFNAGDDFLAYSRAPITECVDFILSDCDKAINVLRIKVPGTDFGRASGGAAYALKSRVLLYLASDWWNGNPDYDGLKNAADRPLFPSYDARRWKDAADAALKCITEAEGAGYGLFKDYADPVQNYQRVFLDIDNSEWMFSRNMGFAQHFDRCCEPVSLGGFSIMNPTQELVDAYEMADGTTPVWGYTVVNPATQEVKPVINPASGYVDEGFGTAAHPDAYYPLGVRNMYVGREPRFYASINFCLQRWKTTSLYFWKTGKDGRDFAGSDYCKTGYLQKKMVDPDFSITPFRENLRSRIFFRLGEIYLNYAEALNEYEGPVSDVYKYVNAIRNRAGLPDLPAGLSKEEMRDKIRHERRIELAFEGHRFFDVRRWKIAPQTDDIWIHSMDILAGTNRTDDAFYKRIGVEKRIFVAPKHYLWPIPQYEVDRNRKGIPQNPGWEEN